MFNVKDIRKDFPMIVNNQNMIYFDSSATSFKPQCVIDKINEYYTKFNSNIHRGDYEISYKVSKEYDETRNVIAKFLNVDNPLEIIYTSGATASLNLVANGYGLNNLKENDVILATLVEHASDILPWFEVANKTKARLEYIPLNEDGTFNLDEYENCFKNNSVKIVTLAYVSNVLGYTYPIKEIVRIAHKYGAIVNVDGAQAVPHIKVDIKDLDIDFLSFSSHKMLGPSGIGVLYGKMNLLEKTKPVAMGGGANARFNKEGEVILKNIPERFEAGTPNIEGVLGLNAAIKYLLNIKMENIEEYCKELSEYAISKMSKLNNVIIYNKDSLSGIITFNIKGIFSQDAASYLNKNNICVRSGNHCAKLLHNIIKTDETIRASLYLYNTKEEIDRFVQIVEETTLEKCVDSIL